MKLSLCIISKGDDEFDKLKTAVGSVIKYVSEVHITCNHKPYKKVSKWCKDNDFDFSFLPWSDNFSEQRNFNFARASKDTDYILWMDSDDVVVRADLLPEIARKAKINDFHSVFFTYWYGAKFNGPPSVENFVEVELEQSRERLLKPGYFIWKKRLHETPVPLDGEKYRYTNIKYSEDNPIAWLHLGADRLQPKEQQDARMDRNRKLLEMDLEDERKTGEADPRTLLYLMKIYAESDDADILKKTIDMGQEYLVKSGWDEERAVCLKLMATAYGKLGDNQTVVKVLLQAIGEYPSSPTLYLYLSKAYYNLRNYKAMKHWLTIALSIDPTKEYEQMNNILELKVLSAELMTKYFLHGEKNMEKAWQASQKLSEVMPTKSNKENEEYLFNKKELELACEKAHKLCNYYEDIGRTDLIPKVYDAMPDEMQRLPFANRLRNKYKPIKIWGGDEICYVATFGGEHFEKWSPNSLAKGIGGSETAVIQLSREWTKLGYKVTVYGDPGKEEGLHDGVLYLPWYKFNHRDFFNIIIQWRSNTLAGKVNCAKFYVDLHDIWAQKSYIDKDKSVDAIFVKSNYHRELAPALPDSLFRIISNGI